MAFDLSFSRILSGFCIGTGCRKLQWVHSRISVMSPSAANHNSLVYPLGDGFFPKPGQLHQVAPGVHWLHMPLPYALDRINLWLLEDGDGWTIIDTGLDLPESRAIWERVLTDKLDGKPVKRVIVTHLHPDHVGLAGWLSERCGCPLWMSRDEFLMCRNLVQDTGCPAPQIALDFYHAAGFDTKQLEGYRKRFGQYGANIHPLPGSFRRLKDGEVLEIDDRFWQVMVGSGHSPEHVCLYCPALKLLISGDQVIPRISSNVSVFPTEPEGNPLDEWLESCHRLRKQLPDNVLVLPAHQEPFHGLHQRLTKMINSHEESLARLLDFLDQPRTAVECFSPLFRRTLKGVHVQLAIGESLAHLNCLLQRRLITRTTDADGVNRYQARTKPAAAPTNAA